MKESHGRKASIDEETPAEIKSIQTTVFSFDHVYSKYVTNEEITRLMMKHGSHSVLVGTARSASSGTLELATLGSDVRPETHNTKR